MICPEMRKDFNNMWGILVYNIAPNVFDALFESSWSENGPGECWIIRCSDLRLQH